MATMNVEVVSAEKRLLSVEADEVYARSLDGEIGILPGHQPCLLALDIAPVVVHPTEGEPERIAVHNGFLYFNDNRLVILADVAEVASQIDVARAEARERQLREDIGPEEDVAVTASLKRQQVRLDIARR